MALDVVGLGLGVVAEARTLAQSILTRIDNYEQGPNKFKTLGTNLLHLTENIDDVKAILDASPGALPTSIKGIFNRTFSRVNESLQKSSDIVEKDFATAFPASSSGFLSKVKSKVTRVTRATSLSDKMKSVETQIKDASDQLSHLTTLLSNALKVDEQQELILPKLDNLRANEPSKEEYRPASSAPAVSHIVNLDFDSKDAEGKFATPEGALKDKVLACMSPETITAAAGKLNAAYGIVGMAGVGKTIALQGLAGDGDIRERFPDGILYMSLGQEATVESVIQEIVRAMTRTGATTSVGNVESAASLREAVDNAFSWFQGKRCLLLIDEVWPKDVRRTGYLPELRQLLRESPDSRMAISTRSVKIALEAGYVVDFGAREPLGAVSVSIFWKYATCSMTSCLAPGTGAHLPPAVIKILTWCGGLPIALSVTGSAVALLVRNVGSLERACEIDVTDFEDRETNVGEEEDPQGTRLSDGIRLSLKYLDVEFSKWKERQAADIEHTIGDLYTSLCVLTNQAWIPVSVLSRLWQLSEKSALDVVQLFCGLSLATVSFRRIGARTVEKAGLTLHDLHLNYCKQEAESKQSTTKWHSALLNGFLEAPSDSAYFSPSTHFSQQLVDVMPRPWWSIPDDSYIHANLARHLSFSGRSAELSALLLDARWANTRGNLGGILGLKADFEVIDKLLDPDNSGHRENNLSRGIRKSFQVVLKAMQLSWGSFFDGRRAFQFQMCGRLLSLMNDDVIIDAVIKSFETHTPKPYVLPVSRFFPELNSAQIWEIPVGGVCRCVASTPCGRYIAAGAGCDIVIADPRTGDVLKRLKGHSDYVECITFAASSKKIISASRDRTVAVWEWETSDVPNLVLEGHSNSLTSVAASSDAKCIVSGSGDCTVRVWNGLTGYQTGVFAQSNVVICVALCRDERKVAIGLVQGSVKVIDVCTGMTLFEDAETHAELVTSVAFSSDGGRMATCSWDKTIRIWDVETWALIGSPDAGHTNRVTSVAFRTDGQQLVSSSYDGTVRLWDVAQTGYPVLSERNIFFSDSVNSVAFACDGGRIVSGSASGIVHVWDAKFVSRATQQSAVHSGSVVGVSISPDGLRVATGSLDRTIRIWDTKTGEQIGIALQGHARRVACVAFSPDGRHLVSSSWDGTLRIWDTSTFAEIGMPFEGHSECVRCVSFSSDGLRLVSGGDDKTVRIWNVHTHEQIGDPLFGHTSRVSYVSESCDGRFVVSRDKNGQSGSEEALIWNRNSRSIIWRSREHDRDTNNGMTNIEAESIIRSCGIDAPHLWPSSFPGCTSEIFCKDYTLYSKILDETILTGNFPSTSTAWKYDGERKVLAAGLSSGVVAVCRLAV